MTEDGKHVAEETGDTPFFNDKTYNFLKWVAQYFLPALGTLYFALASIWGLPYGEEIIGTITAVDIFLGVILGLASKSYNNSDAKYDGEMVPNADPEAAPFSMNLSDMTLEDLQSKKEITLKVQPPA